MIFYNYCNTYMMMNSNIKRLETSQVPSLRRLVK